jgi:hypothetical protein
MFIFKKYFKVNGILQWYFNTINYFFALITFDIIHCPALYLKTTFRRLPAQLGQIDRASFHIGLLEPQDNIVTQ